MANRREFLQRGLSAFFLGLSRDPHWLPHLRVPAAARALDSGLWRTRPLAAIDDDPASIDVHGLPFAAGFFGDAFSSTQIPFHHPETQYPGGVAPAPDEEVEVAIVGGGLSGLTTAYLLRHRHPVVFELHERFGGVAMGETWRDTSFSMGSAYFIAPDKGSVLEGLYHELGLDKVYRFAGTDADLVEFAGTIESDFWKGTGLPDAQVEAFRRYADVVQNYADKSYPDIPLVADRDNAWILRLDQKSLKDDIAEKVGLPIPRLLAAGVQGYCHSSFGAGWEEISAAAGWNFIAAEEYGRWICPGGNAYVADVLWQKLVRAYSHGHLDRLRAGTRAVEVAVQPDGRVRVVYRTPQGTFRSLLARRVVLACSKHICKYLIPGLQQLDARKYEAMQQINTNAYIVANVLLEKPVALDFYDLFLLRDGSLAAPASQAKPEYAVTDVVSGHYAARTADERSVLTLYWPLPWQHGLFTLIVENAWRSYADRLATDLRRTLALLSIEPAAVKQVRMTRWGHAMPIARVGLLSSGTIEHLRRPFRDNVFFVNQDNWALPAFETCLLEAHTFAARIDASL
ncbi:MAG: NAD(P)-binding protein [Planctomycetota bacterium]